MRHLACLLIVLSAVAAVAEGTGRGRNALLFAVPAPAGVKIDGTLATWDTSGGISVMVEPETRAIRNGTIYVMYDADALYYGGDITDATPINNVHDPVTDAARGWNGDASQLRLYLAPTFPGRHSTFEAAKEKPEETASIVHLLFWYYAPTKTPALQLAYGMKYAAPPAWKDGIVPNALYQAAFAVRPDGHGYTFTYRIPWQVLSPTLRLRAGDLTAATLQLHWGSRDGSVIENGGVGNDLMSGPGFGFQSAACWGKLVCAERGRLPAALTQEAVAITPPPPPLPFTFETPRAGAATVALVDAHGAPIRHVAVAQAVTKGTNTVLWDGLDDKGDPLPAGTYAWKAVVHDPLRVQYKLGVHNAGRPSYPTPDGTGAWGGDHGQPSGVACSGTGMLLGWNGCEAGWGFIGTDFAGNKQWGQKYDVHDGCLVADAHYAYLYGGVNGQTGLIRARLDTGMHLKFSDTQPRAALPADAKAGVSGLALAGDTLYAACPGWVPPQWNEPKRDPKTDTEARWNRIACIDTKTGAVRRTVTLPGDASKGQPQLGALAMRDAGSLYAVLGPKVVVVDLTTGAVRDFAVKRLDTPLALAVDAAGRLYVANGGTAQQITVFAPSGKFVRAIGTRGGRPTVGKWDSRGVYNPVALAVDPHGRLWVAEGAQNPKRMSVWDTRKGTLVTEYFGGSHYSTWATMDPADPTRVYCHGVQWRVDLDKGTWRPESIVLTEPMAVPRHPFTLANGRQYAHLRPPAVLMRRGDRFVKVADILNHTTLQDRPWYKTWLAGWNDPAQVKARQARYPYAYPPNGVFWSDLNGDAAITPDELLPNPFPSTYWGGWVDEALAIYSAPNYDHQIVARLKPKAILPNGTPVYDPAMVEYLGPDRKGMIGAPMVSHVLGDSAEDAVYVLGGDRGTEDGRRGYPSLTKLDGQGRLLWGYWACLPSMHAALRTPVPKKGQAYGSLMFVGKAGEIIGAQTYFGTVDLWTTDGLYVDKLYHDQRLGESGPETINAECFSGQLVKTRDGRYFMLGGDTDGRVNQVLGLETLTRVAGTATLTAADVAAARAARAAVAVQAAQAQMLVIHRAVGLNWNTARYVTCTVDEARKFRVAMAYDAQHLLVRYDVDSPAPLTNAVTEAQLVFKGGNAIDLELQTDPGADPARATAGLGDVRLIITRQGNTPVCMAYRKRVPGFTGDPVTLQSPTGAEQFDRIEAIPVTMDYTAKPTGFTATVRLPLAALGLSLKPATLVRLDAGYRFGNATGSIAAQRAYVWNHSPLSAIIYDVPSETRMEPARWGQALVE
jgi:hypothetical protein